MANQQKASGYAFSLNLVRSLGLWSSSASFPKSVTKPAYIVLNPANNTVDWSEQLRKYLKHNSGATTSSDPELVAAQTRLELAIWRAVERKEGSQGYARQVRKAATAPGQVPKASEDWVVRHRKDRDQIQQAKRELEALQSAAGNNTQAASSRIILALAHYALGDFSSCLEQLRSAPSTPTSTDLATHDLDLRILASVLQGLALEHLAAAQSTGQDASHPIIQEALQAYDSLPTHPISPVPEAQKYTEMGLSRSAVLRSHSSSNTGSGAALTGHRQYFALTDTFTSVSPMRRMTMYRSYLSALLDQLSPSPRTHANDESSPPIDTSDIPSTFIAYEKLLYSHSSLASFPRAGEPTPNIYAYIFLLYSFWELGHLQSRWVADSLYRALSKTYASQRIHRYLIFVLSTMSFVETDRRKGKQLADDAMRNLRLYVKLFEKSRETDQMAVQKEMKAFRRKTEGADADEEEGLEDEDEDEDEQDTLETDEDFCRAACIGTRLLLVESRQDNKQEQEDDRLDLIKEALDLIEKAAKTLASLHTRNGQHKDRITRQDTNSQPQSLPVPATHASALRKSETGIIAEVHLWHGVAQAEWLLAEADPETGREGGKKALESLSSAVSSHPPDLRRSDSSIQPKESYFASSLQARALYSLAYAQLEVRDVSSAIVTAKRAVEAISDKSPASDSRTDLRIWHLFVLALSARKDWTKAKEVADLALFGNEAEAYSTTSDQSISMPQMNGIAVSQSEEPSMHLLNPVNPDNTEQGPLSTSRTSAQSNGALDSSSFVHVPSNRQTASRDYAESASLARKASPSGLGSSVARGGLLTHCTTSAWDDLETEIELWITRNKCIEAVEGPEMALQDLQQNVFTRFSKRRDELEISEQKHLAATNAASKGQAVMSRTAQTSAYPYPSQEAQRSQVINRKLDHQRSHTVSAVDSPGRARSIIGSLRRNRARTDSPKLNGTTGFSATNTRPGSIHSNASNATSGSGSNLIGSGASIHSNTVHTVPSHFPAKSGLPHPQAAKILSRLWLTSAASFRRWGKLDECRGAINEAEDVAGETDAEVWVQYALYLTARSPAIVNGKNRDVPSETNTDVERAILSYQKALAIATDNEAVIVGLGRLHSKHGIWAIAEGFLDVATQTNAWDSSEAWYLLAKVYEATGRGERARECLVYALELEGTRPIRDIRSVLRRWV